MIGGVDLEQEGDMDDTILEAGLQNAMESMPPDVIAAYLFGSVARGKAGPESDVDIAVLYRDPPPRTLAGLEVAFRMQDELQSKVGRKIDLVVLNTAPLDLTQRVLRDGKILIDRDRGARIRFEVKTRMAFLDFLPVLNRYRRFGGEEIVTDPELLAKKLAFIETCVAEIRRLSDVDRMATDLREERFVIHTLQIAIQAALDIGSHIISDLRLGEPGSYRDVFQLLVKSGWLPAELAQSMRNMAGFRNVVVHGYEAVDSEVVREIVRARLDDLLLFASAIRAHLKDE